MNTPPGIDLRPLPRVDVDAGWAEWLLPTAFGRGGLANATKHARLERLAMAALGLGAVVALTAAYISTGPRAADVPTWVFRAWHFWAPLVLAAAATLGFGPGCSRLVRTLTVLTVVAYALPAALDRWGLPAIDGVSLKLGYGIAVLAGIGGRLATRFLRGHRESAV